MWEKTFTEVKIPSQATFVLWSVTKILETSSEIHPGPFYCPSTACASYQGFFQNFI